MTNRNEEKRSVSLLYPNEGKATLSMSITRVDNKINFLFESDCGKFGCDEIMDEHELTIKELMEALRAYEEKREGEEK